MNNNDCSSRIVFIGLDDPLDLRPMVPYLQRLSEQVPAEALDFQFISEVTPQNVDQRVMELEALVNQYVRAGYTHIGLPSEPTLLRPFILGTGGRLNNIPIQRRWPNTQFMVQDPGIVAVNYASNVYRFGDINTLFDPSLISYNLRRYIQGAGEAYVVYQGAGDAVSTELANTAIRALREMGITTSSYEVGGPNNTFNDAAIEDAVRAIREDLPPRPSQSVVIHIVNWLNAEEYTQSAIRGNLLSTFEDRVVHYAFGNEYYPVETALPVRLQIGRIPLEGIPSMEAASLGVPLEPADYYAFPYLLTYLDSYLWAATCGQTDGVNDKQLKFDTLGTRISYFLADVFFPPGSLSIQVGPRYMNPRWWSPSRPVVPDRR